RNCTIILDSGTTTLEVAKLLNLRDDLTIVTNDIQIANMLLHSSNRVIVSGGKMQNFVGNLYGTVSQNLFKEINADIFLMGAHALDLVKGITAPSLDISATKQIMKKSSNETWVLADFSKF